MRVASKSSQNAQVAAPRGLLTAVALYLVVTFFRPQDLISGLAVLKPGMLATVAILLLWMASKDFGHLLDAIVKWQVMLLGVLVAGIVVVVNHRYWFDTTLNFAAQIVSLTCGLVAVTRFKSAREAILKLVLVALLFQTVWAISHAGRGTGAFFGDENDTAIAMIVGGSLAYAMWIHWPKGAWRWFAMIALILSLVGIIVTGSRGGFLGLVATVAAVLFFSGRLLKTAVLLGLLVVAGYPFVPAEYKSDITSISNPEDETRVERVYSWKRAVDLWHMSPIIGVGAGNFPWRVVDVEQTAKAFEERRGRRVLGGRVSHSIYFTVLPENGALGVLCYLALLLIAFRRAVSIVRRRNDRNVDHTLRTIGLFIAVGLIGYSVAGAFVSVLWYPHFWLMAALAILLSPSATIDLHGVVSWAQSGSGRRLPASKGRTSGRTQT